MNKSTRDNEQMPPAGGNVLAMPAAVPRPGDVVAELLRNGAQALLEKALEAEIAAHLASYESLQDSQGRQRIVRNGYLPQRELQTGVGPVEVQVPRARDQEPHAAGGPIQFRSTLLPPYLRRSAAMDELLPWLHLKGISTGDFGEALEALVGPQARGLSSSTISRLKQVWAQEYEEWSQRDLRGQRFVYLWIDGIFCQARLEEEKQCLLVAIGADAEGRKQLVGLTDGYRESEQSWLELLLDLQRRGLEAGPELAIGDGALGFWKAIRKVYPQTRTQRCWVHKTRNVLDKLPKGGQSKAKAALQAIWLAATKREAESAFQHFQRVWGPRVPAGWRFTTSRPRVPDEGPRGAAGVLRLPGRALAALADDEPDRERVRDSAAEDSQDARLPEPEDGVRDGVPAVAVGAGEMAQAKRNGKLAQGDRRSKIRRRVRQANWSRSGGESPL